MQAHVKKKIEQDNEGFDMEELQKKLSFYASASFQRTYSNFQSVIFDEENRQNASTYEESEVDQLLKFTIRYFQRDKQAMTKFMSLVQEFQSLSLVQDLYPLFHHHRIDGIIDKQQQYSQFQEIIDELEQFQFELIDGLLLESQMMYSLRLRENINQLKSYYPFIEALTTKCSELTDVVKGSAITNFFCYIVRTDRIRPSFKIIYFEYFRKLNKLVVS